MYKVKERDRIDNWRRYLLHIGCVRRNQDYRKGYEELIKQRSERGSEDFSWTLFRDMVASRWGLFWGQDIPVPNAVVALKAICESPPS